MFFSNFRPSKHEHFLSYNLQVTTSSILSIAITANMAPNTYPKIALADHETFHSDGNGICYVLFSRENEKRPGKYYEQLDVLPFASADSDATFVRPRTAPIPTYFAHEDEQWIPNKADKTWTRAGLTWGPPSLVLRQFNYRGEYK